MTLSLQNLNIETKILFTDQFFLLMEFITMQKTIIFSYNKNIINTII